MMRVDAVAKELDTSVQTIYKLLESGELKGVNIGTRKRRDWRVSELELARFVERGGVR